MQNFPDIASLPATLPVFPLAGVILLPRVNLPLNLFETRYLAMFDHALARERMIVMVQPVCDSDVSEPDDGDIPVRGTGTVGRIIAWQEADDEHYIVALSGICRCLLTSEKDTDAPFRTFNLDYAPYSGDLEEQAGEDAVDRNHLLSVLKTYLNAHDLRADWESIDASNTEFLVNTLAMIGPFAEKEKQALLEAPDLKTRADILVALAEMELASTSGAPGSGLQ